MKTTSNLLLVAALAVSSLLAGATSSFAHQPNSTFTYVPVECAKAMTKTNHPNWYRDGGYCNPHDWDD